MVNNLFQISRSRIGGLRRIELYGNPGTTEGRSRGGRRTIRIFHNNPDLAKKSGFIIRKKIKYPRESPGLAEFIGIVLGDGGVSGNHQITVSFNYKTDYGYAKYVCRIAKQLFLIGYHVHKRRNSNGADVVFNSSELVDFLISKGIKTGNKVKNQVGVPLWIRKNILYEKACLRGLIDTDGSLYSHKYYVGEKPYQYLKLGFSNRSKPLIKFVSATLKKLGHKVYLREDSLSVSSKSDLQNYFTKVGSSNPKHIGRFNRFFNK